jgi:glyoxylase-like metal-dependent hydrolase (beta-lactamase superfamily II)
MQRNISRRSFLLDLGKSSLGLAVFGIGIVACTEGGEEVIGATTSSSSAPASSTTSAGAGPSTTAPASASTTAPPATQPPAQTVAWHRVDLGFVSAYLLVRGGDLAIVDTGVAGSAGDIEAALGAVDLGWEAVGHVILTHSHQDHQGSLVDVLAAAPDAEAYAGTGDIPNITSPKPLVAVGDGDRVFGLDIIETPGHTPGHISVLDPSGSLLVAGDALNGSDGGVIGPNPQFSADMTIANQSVAKLAGFPYEALLFGHGDPVESGASDLVAALAATL